MMRRLAAISPDGLYRYGLARIWSTQGPCATFVMLNPSTADAKQDDPTIRRCVDFARSWGMGGLYVVNLYAYRSTDPRALWAAADPVGPKNDDYLRRQADLSQRLGWPLVAAWGANAKAERVEQVLTLPGMREALQCLGVTKGGAPRHPLYLPATSELRQWPAAAAAA